MCLKECIRVLCTQLEGFSGSGLTHVTSPSPRLPIRKQGITGTQGPSHASFHVFDFAGAGASVSLPVSYLGFLHWFQGRLCRWLTHSLTSRGVRAVLACHALTPTPSWPAVISELARPVLTPEPQDMVVLSPCPNRLLAPSQCSLLASRLDLGTALGSNLPP